MLMAVAHVMGAWDREMMIPYPTRATLVEYHNGHWKLDAHGYPVPSEALRMEYEYLLTMEQSRDQTSSK